MYPTRTFIALTLAGLPLAVLGAASPWLILAAFGWLACCGAVLVALRLFGAQPGDVEIQRQVAERLNLGETEPVTLLIRNNSRYPLSLDVTDDTPHGWGAAGLPGSLRIPARSEVELTYHVTPPARGKREFGDIHFRFRQSPGLLGRVGRISAVQAVRVYPDMREVSRYEDSVRRNRLSEFGVRRARLVGRGTEFERLRDYTADDEYRQIDWKATARRHRPISRVYEVERSQNIFIVLDAGWLMAGRVGRLARLDYAVNGALMLAHVALRSGDKVGVMVVSDDVDAYLPLGKGTPHFNRCLELLYGAQARRCHVDYRAALEQVSGRLNRRALVVFFTDLYSEETSHELVTYLRLLRPTHLPLLVTLQDNQIVAASRRPTTTVASLYERAVSLDLLGERKRLVESVHKMGGLVIDCAAHELTMTVVNRYLELKARGTL